MKRKLLLFLAIAATVALQASDICIDGIYYLFEGDEAVVTYKGANARENPSYYKGAITIPATVTYESKVYTVTKIDEGAFYMDEYVTEVNMPNTITVIGRAAFAYTSIIEANIPDGVDSIASDAYNGLFLEKISIGKSLRKFDLSSFSVGNEDLRQIEISPCNPYYTSGDNCNAIIDRKTKELVMGCRNTKIPNYVKKIGTNAFFQCLWLTTVEIPQNVEVLDYSAFGLSGVEELILGPDVNFIAEDCFDMCFSLLTVICYCTTPPTFEDTSFGFGLLSDMMIQTIYVPRGTKTKYMSTAGWENYANYKEIDVPARQPDEVMPAVKCEETDLDIIPANNKLSTRKVIRNGRLFLYNNEHIYTITGAKLQ